MVMQQQLSPRGGLTLIEIVIATAVLSVVLLGMFTAMNNSQRADMLTRERAAAAEACHAMLDSMLTGTVPGSGNVIEVQFPVYYQTGNGELDTTNGLDDDGDGVIDDFGGVPLTPAVNYPSDPWTFSGTSQPTMTVAGIAIAKAGVDVGDGTPSEVNDDLMEVRVLVAWRSVDGTDQRIEAISRRVR